MTQATTDLSAATAAQWAATILAAVNTPYPVKLDHVITHAADQRAPEHQHPVFWGCYDWHSCCHMHWSLFRLRAACPAAPWRPDVESHLAARITAKKVAGELAYWNEPGRTGFERPYGWAWLLKLHAELLAAASTDRLSSNCAEALAPLAHAVAQRLKDYLPKARYPNRAGTHGNSAFALLLAAGWAGRAGDTVLQALIATKAMAWYRDDTAYPAHYEPSGEDFLAPGLVEAALMRRVLAPDAFANWWQAFAPTQAGWQHWLTPVTATDRADPKIAHLDGVNFTRAWCWRQLLPAVPADQVPAVRLAIDAHLCASLPAVTGDYMGAHWLASFALLALDGT